MATIYREINIEAPAEQLWDAMRDPGALHTRLVPGFVVACDMEPIGADGLQVRTLRFGNDMEARELIVDIDDTRRRIAWSAVGGRLTHHNASAEVQPDGEGRCRVLWTADLLPHSLAPAIATMIEAGLAAMKAHAERSGT